MERNLPKFHTIVREESLMRARTIILNMFNSSNLSLGSCLIQWLDKCSFFKLQHQNIQEILVADWKLYLTQFYDFFKIIFQKLYLPYIINFYCITISFFFIIAIVFKPSYLNPKYGYCVVAKKWMEQLLSKSSPSLTVRIIIPPESMSNQRLSTPTTF